MITQIYEISSPEEAKAVAALGVDHIGILVGDGSYPRELSIEAARSVVAAVPKPAKSSVLSLSGDVDYILEIAQKTKPDILHLGAMPDELTVEEVRELRKKLPGLPLMRSIPVDGQASLTLAKSYDGLVNFLLLDTYDAKSGLFGATGKVNNWNVGRTIVESVRTHVILAGGLGPDNVAEAIKAVGPVGVDCKTKTDLPDKQHKDLKKVAAFVRNAQTVEGK